MFCSHERVFTKIYREHGFGGKASVSGPGSDLSQTKSIVEALPTILEKFGIATILDIPCGDCHWMDTLDLGRVRYVGADIVRALVKENTHRLGWKGMQFRHLNLITDQLPPVDLVLCRDCLVHFSYRDIFKALRNICRSGSTYLLTTTFVSRRSNEDILTGQWRPLNLSVPPFCLPQPVTLVNEGCGEHAGTYGDKSLGLWRIEDIAKWLKTGA